MITYRVVTDQEGYKQVNDLEMVVWNMDAADAIGIHTQMVITHTGGCVLAAYDGERIVGATVAFAMGGEPRLWSHLAMVHPDYQRQGIGYQLKQHQREWALQQGYQYMSWTFDPLMAVNAHFNFRMLNAHCQTYHVNFYGDMQDGLNAGMPSDRFEMLWTLVNPLPVTAPLEAPFLLIVGSDGQPIIGAAATEHWHFVEIPADFPAIRQQDKGLAVAWKEALRQTIAPAFDAGFWAVDFVRRQERNWYALHRGE